MHVLLAEELGREMAAATEEEEMAWMRSAVGRGFARMDDLALAACACGKIGLPPCGCERSGIESEIVGSTAVVALVDVDRVVVANCGDSRAVLSRGGQAVPLSSDHKVSPVAPPVIVYVLEALRDIRTGDLRGGENSRGRVPDHGERRAVGRAAQRCSMRRGSTVLGRSIRRGVLSGGGAVGQACTGEEKRRQHKRDCDRFEEEVTLLKGMDVLEGRIPRQAKKLCVVGI
ncbi:hypothetical protein B296_00000323 [Ensete ventricosum]|uniref:protein-serine/threonine phosphatase n=1 Tax=Ensete ventricosum TaxID=4639 RepID=A0A427B7S0_ENSVE|nr:hypothetical protein B296_00000323 [Ensete ventricosum]